jgi:hypothetical protein
VTHGVLKLKRRDGIGLYGREIVHTKSDANIATMSFLVNDANAVDGRSLLDDGPSIWDATLVLQPDHTLLSDSSAALLVPVVASEDYSSSCFVAMNRFEVKEDSKSLFEERWSQRQSKLPHQPGFLGFSLLRKAATKRRTPTTTQRRRLHDLSICLTILEALLTKCLVAPQLRKAGLLPKSIRCDPNLILDGRELLLNNGPNMADV